MTQGSALQKAERQRQNAALLGMNVFSDETNQALDQVSRIARDLFDCEAAIVAFPHGRRLLVRGTSGIPLPGRITLDGAAAPEEVVLADDDGAAPILIDLITRIHPSGRSAAFAPVGPGSSGPVGFLMLISERDHHFASEQRDKIADFAALVSTGIGAFASEYEAREAHRSRAESERRLRALLESFPDLIFRLSRHGEYRDVHAPDGGSLVADDLIGKNLHDVLDEDLAARLLLAIRRSIGGESLQYVEYELDTVAHGRRHFEARIMPCAHDEVVFTVRDITEARLTATHLKARESLLDAVMRATIILLTRPSLSIAVRDAFALLGNAVDVDRVYQFENHVGEDGRLLFSQRFEWTREDVTTELDNPALQGMDYEEVLPGLYEQLERGEPAFIVVDELDEDLKATMQSQDIQSILLVPIHQNSDFIGFVGFDDCRQKREWSETEVSVLMTAAACLGGAIVQRKSRFELGNSRARYKALVDNVNDVIFQADLSGTILFVNPSWEHVTGRTVEAAIGRRMHDFVSKEDATVLDRCMQALTEQEVSECRHDLRMTCLNGTAKWVHLYARASHDESGRISGIFGTLHDVTERRLYEDALVAAKDRAEEMAMLKSSFLANMSHEIRTPLTSILGFSQILMEELAGEQREMIDLIVRNGNRLMDTLSSVLELARLESHDVRLNVQPVRIDREVQEMVRLFSHRTRQSGVVLRYDAPGALICHTDASILRRVLDNLVGNALKFTAEGEVVLQAREDDGTILVAVRDTGVGIEEAFLANLFEDFTQESSGLDRQFEGAGLGLAITRRMVDLLGATISVESQKGVGSTFTLALPKVLIPASRRAVPIEFGLGQS
jgi:PAS domain S-box-containing protein